MAMTLSDDAKSIPGAGFAGGAAAIAAQAANKAAAKDAT
jgi:hypothetical protein